MSEYPKKTFIARDYQVTINLSVAFELPAETETEAGEMLDFRIDGCDQVHKMVDRNLRHQLLNFEDQLFIIDGRYGRAKTLELQTLNASDITGE